MKKIILVSLLAGVVNLAASMLISAIFGVIFPALNAEYANLSLFRAKTDPLMLLFFLHPFLLSFLLAWFWTKSKNMFGEDIKGGINFGIFYWVISTIPGMFATYTSMPYSLLIVISWTVGNLVQTILAGIIFSKFLSSKTSA